MKIGIGIITYNRLHCLKKCLESIFKTDSYRLSKIVIADDCSNDGTREWLRRQGKIIPVFGQKNWGIARNSNRALKELLDCDYGFLINDDIYFKQRGWVDIYIDAMKISPYKHFCFMGGEKGPGFSKKEGIGNIEVTHHHLVMGSCLAFTKKVLETIGGFDIRFPAYGLEHTDWTERVSMAGLSRNFDIHGVIDGLKVVDIANSHKYIGDIPTSSVFDDLTKLRYHNEALKISEEIRAELMRSGMKNLYRPFITDEI